MPAASPWLDTAAPPQYAYFRAEPQPDPVAGTGAGSSGPFGFLGRMMGTAASNSGVDSTVHIKVAGAVIIALVIIFGVSAMGFRFVSSANLSLGR